MSTINPLINNNAYYQLSDTGATAPGTSSASDPTDALLQALSSASSDPSSPSSNSAYLLDLSPQAQQYLNGGSSALPGTNPSFTLTPQQQQTITNILAKYKNAPYTQDTFNQIQADLNAAGLGPNQLSLEDQAKNFDPTEILVDDLSGNYAAADTLASTSSAGEQTKASNYMQQIIGQWKTLSGQDSAATTTSGA